MKTYKNYLPGSHVDYHTAYDRDAIKRFPIIKDPNGYYRSETPVPCAFKGVGIVVGYRHIIVDGYKTKGGNMISEDEWELTYADGKKETVLLVCENPWQEFKIVRIQDIITL